MSVCVYIYIYLYIRCVVYEIVVIDSDIYIYRLGLGTSVRIRFGSPFSSKIVVCGHCLVILSLTINETLKWLSSLPILMQESFWW